MSSLIECLSDPECADKLRQAQGRYTMEDVVTRYDNKLDTWKVTASSGDHTVQAENLGHAYLRFVESHPDDFVQAIQSVVEGHSALCRSRIGGESEDRCNCAAGQVDEYLDAETDREINVHEADYPGTYDNFTYSPRGARLFRASDRAKARRDSR